MNFLVPYFFVIGTSCHYIEKVIILLYQKFCPDEVTKIDQMNTSPN